MAVEISQHQFIICQASNGQFCNIHTPFQPLAKPPSCITALYTKNTANISTRCSLQIRKTQNINIPSQIAPNVWILTTAPSAVTTAVTPICPGETTKFLTVKKPIYILHLLPTCSATSPNFHLPPQYEHQPLAVNISLDMGKPKHNQHIVIKFSYMATPRETSDVQPASALSQHSFSSSELALQVHNQWHSPYHTFHIT